MERQTCKHKARFPFLWLFSLIVLYVTQSARGICVFVVRYASALGKTDCKHTISQSAGMSERGENAGILVRWQSKGWK